ncbi:MAG: hypothetical protein J5824_02910, partial [Lachnospiraceae bacterium]|nr:hypothetical protein [Lachnospiraceae bacterium]
MSLTVFGIIALIISAAGVLGFILLKKNRSDLVMKYPIGYFMGVVLIVLTVLLFPIAWDQYSSYAADGFIKTLLSLGQSLQHALRAFILD